MAFSQGRQPHQEFMVLSLLRENLQRSRQLHLETKTPRPPEAGTLRRGGGNFAWLFLQL